MSKQAARIVDWVFQNEQFDANWYRDAFPDVATLKMDPETHYRRYGSLMQRAPNAALASDPEQIAALTLPAPKKRGELLAAHEIALTGAHDRAVHYARRHLPSDLAHTLHVLEANRALAADDQTGWLEHMNSYLRHFGVAELQLGEGASLMEQLTTAPLPPVTDGPLVSVLMPAWNAEKTIGYAIRSILSQTWRNLELLIVDDASEDGTWEIIQQFAARDPRVRVWRNSVNVGPYVSKNVALTQAKGEWITGHDADDWAHPKRLENHFDAAVKRNLQASITYMIRMQPHGAFSHIGAISPFSPDAVARKASISCLFERQFLDQKLGFWDAVRFGADSELIARAEFLLGDKFAVLPQISMLCLDLETSLTNHSEHGVRTSTGSMSPTRVAYRAAWSNWHQSATVSELRFDINGSGGRYAIPVEMAVSKTDIQKNRSLISNNDGISYACKQSILPYKAKKITCVFFDFIVSKIIDEGLDVNFDAAFYQSSRWPTRPNSTSRLDIISPP